VRQLLYFSFIRLLTSILLCGRQSWHLSALDHMLHTCIVSYTVLYCRI